MSYMASKLRVQEADRVALEGWLRSPTLSQEWVLRAKIVLASAAGEGPRATARRLEISANTVCVWRRRYREQGLAGLKTRARSGRPREISVAKERAVIAATMRPPKAGTHWSTRALAREVGLSHMAVQRIWKKHGLQPHRVETFKLSRDPEFDRKMADIVGLYLDPPERALVLSVDEKSQIQALNRTQPILPLRPGIPARMTHDYQRNGTTSLFAALEVASGKVHGRCFPRHTHVEFIAFLDSIAKRYARREIHLICDNYGTHKHPKVHDWLAAHPRFHIHFTPTSASWLKLVESWFSVITRQAIRRGSFDSVRRLERAITKYIAEWNEHAQPFRWTTPVREIRRKIRRVKAISVTEH
jgi:transposase